MTGYKDLILTAIKNHQESRHVVLSDIWRFLMSKNISVSDYIIRRDIKRLIEMDLVMQIGLSRSTHYVTAEYWNKVVYG